MIAEYLDRAIRLAGIAITGVSIGRLNDRSTWLVQPTHLQAAAQPTIDAFTEPTPQQLADEEAIREADLRILRAIVIELHASIPAHAGKPTLVQLRNNIIARYKAL